MCVYGVCMCVYGVVEPKEAATTHLYGCEGAEGEGAEGEGEGEGAEGE